MRREGFEMQVSQPKVIFKEGPNGEKLEPIEDVVIEVDADYAGTVINKLQQRKGEMRQMNLNNDGSQRLEFSIPSRGLFGYRSEFLTDTRGTGVMYSNFDKYEPYRGEMHRPRNGAMIVLEKGQTTIYSLHNLQERGVMFVGPGEDVYPGQIVGENAKDNDLVVNPTKKKQLNNVRAAGNDDALILTPPRTFSLEQAIEFIGDDEYVEITPSKIRIRKAILDHSRRKRK